MGGRIITDAQRNMLGGDIIEDRGNVIYVGIFDAGTDETGTENCLIRKIEQVEDPDTKVVTTRIMYPDGINHECGHTWSERDNYNYRYANAK